MLGRCVACNVGRTRSSSSWRVRVVGFGASGLGGRVASAPGAAALLPRLARTRDRLPPTPAPAPVRRGCDAMMMTHIPTGAAGVRTQADPTRAWLLVFVRSLPRASSTLSRLAVLRRCALLHRRADGADRRPRVDGGLLPRHARRDHGDHDRRARHVAARHVREPHGGAEREGACVVASQLFLFPPPTRLIVRDQAGDITISVGAAGVKRTVL